MPDRLSVLLVKLSSIGDVVLFTPVARALRRHVPEARISWVVEPKSAGILEGNPDLDEVIVWRRRSLRDLVQLVRRLREHEYDAALDLQGLARSAFLALISGARRRIGYAYSRECSTLAYNVRVKCQRLAGCEPDGHHTMLCRLAVLGPLGVACDGNDDEMRVGLSEEERVSAAQVLARNGIRSDDRIVSLCPATTRDSKHWTEEGWSALADALWDEMGLRSVLLGSEANQPLMWRIMSGASAPAISIAGQTTLKEAAAVLAASDAVVAVDTGLLHVGVALGRPTVGVFGPTPHWRNHARRPNFAVVRRDLDCAPCGSKPGCERFECITRIQPAEVVDAMRTVLARTGTARGSASALSRQPIPEPESLISDGTAVGQGPKVPSHRKISTSEL